MKWVLVFPLVTLSPASPSSPLVLSEDDVHVHVTWVDAAEVRARVPAYEALLAPDERERRARYRFARHQHEYLVTRALARRVLGHYAGVLPESLVFRNGPWGKPEIAAPEGAAWLSFNLSNTEGVVACAVTRGREVGVDVEWVDRGGQLLEVAERYFAPAEVAALRALPPFAQLPRFFVYWTLKEAYIKARGMGLALPLADFAFDVSDQEAPRIAFSPSLSDVAGSWRFGTTMLAPTVRLSYAARYEAAASMKVSLHETIP